MPLYRLRQYHSCRAIRSEIFAGGQKLMATKASSDKSNAATNGNGQTEYKVIGTRPIRHDGADKVTGRAIYGNDVQLTGLIHGKVLRSPHAHAKIKSIDTS